MTNLLDADIPSMSEAPRDSQSSAYVFRTSESDFQRYAPSAGFYRGAALLDLTRKDIIAVLALRGGQEYADDRYRFRIDDVDSASIPLVVRARISRAETMFDRRAPVRFSFFLRNRGRHEAIRAFAESMKNTLGFFGGSEGQSGGGGGFSTSVNVFRFSEWRRRADERIHLTADWIRDAEFVIVRDTTAASVPRVLEISNFPLRVTDAPR